MRMILSSLFILTTLTIPAVRAQDGTAPAPKRSELAKAVNQLQKEAKFPRFDRAKSRDMKYRAEFSKLRAAAMERYKASAKVFLGKHAEALAKGEGLYYRGMLQSALGEAKASADSYAAFRKAVPEHPRRAAAGVSLLQAHMYATKDYEAFKALAEEMKNEDLDERMRATVDRLVGGADSFAKRHSLVGKPLPTIPVKQVVGAESFAFPVKGKVTVIDFWATWCAPCRKIIPNLVRLQEKYGDKLQVVGLTRYYGYGWEYTNRDGDNLMGKRAGSRKEPLTEARELEINEIFHKGVLNYPIVFTGKKVAGEVFGVRGIPTVFVVDQEGIVRWYKVGSGDEKSLHHIIEKLCAKS